MNAKGFVMVFRNIFVHSTTISSYNDFKGFPVVIIVASVFKIFDLFIE